MKDTKFCQLLKNLTLHPSEGKYPNRRGEGGEEWSGGPLWSPAVPLQDTGGELPVKAERSDGHWGRDPIYRARSPGETTSRGWGGQRRKQNTQFATSTLQDGEPKGSPSCRVICRGAIHCAQYAST
jgi:hypothetical protein